MVLPSARNEPGWSAVQVPGLGEEAGAGRVVGEVMAAGRGYTAGTLITIPPQAISHDGILHGQRDLIAKADATAALGGVAREGAVGHGQPGHDVHDAAAEECGVAREGAVAH